MRTYTQNVILPFPDIVSVSLQSLHIGLYKVKFATITFKIYI